MALTNFQIDGETQQEREEEDKQSWWERWRRLDMAQVLCYVVYAIYMLRVYYDIQHYEPEISGEDKKCKVRIWERQFESIKESIDDVAEAIREGNASMEKARQHVRSEQEVYAELVKIGVERHLRYTAYNFLTQDPARVRTSFGARTFC